MNRLSVKAKIKRSWCERRQKETNKRQMENLVTALETVPVSAVPLAAMAVEPGLESLLPKMTPLTNKIQLDTKPLESLMQMEDNGQRVN